MSFPTWVINQCCLNRGARLWVLGHVPLPLYRTLDSGTRRRKMKMFAEQIITNKCSHRYKALGGICSFSIVSRAH